MTKTRDIQGVVTGQGIGIGNTVRHHHLVADWPEHRRLRLGNGCGIDFPAVLQNAENRDFSRSPATTAPFPSSALITFIDLFSRDRTGFSQFCSIHLAQMMGKRNRSIPMYSDEDGDGPGGVSATIC